MRRVFRQIYRFSTASSENVEQKASSNIAKAEQQQQSEVPVYLRPYDKSKYEVPAKKIKKNSGYALLQIEPFPRARIIKIGLNVLQQLKIGIPEDFVERIYLEERTKYMMELADKVEDIQELEEILGTDSIQLTIVALARHLEYIPIMRKMKLWERKQQGLKESLEQIKPKESLKYPIYRKGDRIPDNLLDVV